MGRLRRIYLYLRKMMGNISLEDPENGVRCRVGRRAGCCRNASKTSSCIERQLSKTGIERQLSVAGIERQQSKTGFERQEQFQSVDIELSIRTDYSYRGPISQLMEFEFPWLYP